MGFAIAQFPLFVIPYPLALPNVPYPSTCPCYYMESQKNNTNMSPVSAQSLINQHFGNGQTGQGGMAAFGFIPLLFVPYCGQNGTNANALQGSFPSAIATPYPCSACNYQQGPQGRSLGDGAENNSFQQVMALANINPFANSFVKSPHRRVRARRIRVGPVLDAPIVIPDDPIGDEQTEKKKK